MQKSTSLKYEPSLGPIHISAEWLFVNRTVQLSVQESFEWSVVVHKQCTDVVHSWPQTWYIPGRKRGTSLAANETCALCAAGTSNAHTLNLVDGLMRTTLW